MNKKAMTALLSATIVLGGLGSGVAYAAAGDSASSTANVEFEPDNSSTDPGGDKDDQDDQNGGTGMPGPLSLDYIPSIQFGKHPVPTTTTTYNAKNNNPYVQVTDKTGSMEGWNVTVKESGFKSGANTLVADLTFKGSAATISPLASDNTSAKPTGKDVTLTSADQAIFSAAKDAGAGTWLMQWPAPSTTGEDGNNTNVTLKVLTGNGKVGTFVNDLTWTINAGPTK